MTAEPKKHIIAAKNILFGTGYFLILSLPEGWRITRSYLEPDIHSTVRREHITWVEAGQTDQIVFNPLKKIALNLVIQVKRGKHEGPGIKGVQVSSQGSRMVCGHPASYCIGEVKEGLFKKKSRQTLRFFLYCPELNRTLFLHFTDKCTNGDLIELFESIRSLECH